MSYKCDKISYKIDVNLSMLIIYIIIWYNYINKINIFYYFDKYDTSY